MRVRRWLVASLGLAIAAAALYLMAAGGAERPGAEIDNASRARLEAVLREEEDPGR